MFGMKDRIIGGSMPAGSMLPRLGAWEQREIIVTLQQPRPAFLQSRECLGRFSRRAYPQLFIEASVASGATGK